MWQTIVDNKTKLLGTATTVIATMLSMIALGMFGADANSPALLEPVTIRWMTIILSLVNVALGGGTIAAGMSNSVKIAQAQASVAASSSKPLAQGGFMKIGMFPTLLLAALAAVFVGCAGTRAAYQAAEDLEDTAYVMSEHYAALVTEGIRLRNEGALAGAALTRAQQIEARARPVVLKMGEAARAWEAVKSAENEAALQAAITAAVPALRELVDALKAARPPSTELLRIEAQLVEVV